MGLTTTEQAAANLRAELARRNLSGSEFGRRMGWSKNTSGRKLNGHSALTTDELDAAAAALGVGVLTIIRAPIDPEAVPA